MTLEHNASELAGFVHIWVPAPNDAPRADGQVLLLLHGTGGSEYDMLDLGRAIAPTADLLSPRGRVLEGRSNRFFRRLAEGVFDLHDLRLRTLELAAFIRAASAKYTFDTSRVAIVGFSNGANIAASLLLTQSELITRSILLSPMVPFEPDISRNMSGCRVFIGAGRNDPIAPPETAERLAELLRISGADVTMYFHPDAHTVTLAEIQAAAAWLVASDE